MTDTSQAENPPHTNGISNDIDEEDRGKMRPADIDADVREMERRKRVESIMNSKLFREELERIIETQLKDGIGTSGLMQQISDMMGVSKNAGNIFKNSNCVVPINDIRGIEAMGYAKGEKILRCKMAAVYRLIDLYGWAQDSSTLITARLNQDEEQFLVNPYGMLFHELTASSLIKVGMQGNIIEQGTTNFPVNITAFSLHAAVHAARPDIKCIIHVRTPSVIAISSLKSGILPLSQESVVIGEISVHPYSGAIQDAEEKEKIARNLGPINKVLLLTNQGAVCCGETIEEAFFNARNTVLACESQLKLIPAGLDNLILLLDETRKKFYDAARRPPESTPRPDQPTILEGKVEKKWRVGGVEFEALMRMLDNAGFRTGYIYRHPLVKGDPPKPKNDVEIPPAVSSLGYILEEEELYRQGLWKKLEGGRKGNDRTRWLNSPHTYQKVEILETGTSDPKKITKWVQEDSPTHSSTPVKIDSALQFVPKNTNPKEFKRLQQQIKDYRRADKISAGPQSHILEGVTWEEAKKMQDAGVTQTGDQVVLMGAASKGIIQRGYQHNAMMYKSPYAKNPFDSVTDEELDEYKKVVEKKTKGEYDTDYSESESAQISKHMDSLNIRSPTSITSETEEESRDEPQILRIETKQAPRPSQPEVVLSDGLTKVRTRVQENRSFYRTQSHAGFPKGSYSVPNPTHFHIARYTYAPVPLQPALIRVLPQNERLHKRNFSFEPKKPSVTINIGNTRTVSLNISMQTLREFIYPLATALNFINLPAFSNKSSQTSYVTSECFSSDEDLSDFEYNIIRRLKEHLVHDVCEEATLSENEIYTEHDSAMVKEIASNEELDNLEVFDFSQTLMEWSEYEEDDYFEKNQYQALKLDPQIFYNITSLDAELESVDEENETTSSHGDFVIDESWNFPVEVILSEGIVPNEVNAEKASPDLIITKDIELPYCASSSKTQSDEGFNDSSSLISSNHYEIHEPSEPVTEGVLMMSQAILDYLVKQCYEIKELVLFPEVNYDENIHKVFLKLKQLYTKFYGEECTDEQKNELRISITQEVLKQLQMFDSRASASSSEDSFVSDKLFSISEFVSDILDSFFGGIIDAESFSVFKQTLVSSNQDCSSTPQGKQPNSLTDEEEIISFQKNVSEKSGNESYWFAVQKKSLYDLPKSPQVPRRIINIDDIPLRPPSFFENRSHSLSSGRLSPIPEEPSRRLFDSEPDDSCSDDDFHKCSGYSLNGVDLISPEKDIFAGGDTYVAYDRPEINVVVCDAVEFCRTKTINVSSYQKASEVRFDPNKTRTIINRDGEVVDEDDGDWMGYESAVF